VVEVRIYKDRVVLCEGLAEFIVDPHRQHHRDPRTNANDFDVLDGTQPTEDVVEAFCAEQQRVATTDEHIANAGLAFDIREGVVNLVSGWWGFAADDAPPVAMATIDGAAIEDVEQATIRVLVKDARYRGVAVFA